MSCSSRMLTPPTSLRPRATQARSGTAPVIAHFGAWSPFTAHLSRSISTVAAGAEAVEAEGAAAPDPAAADVTKLDIRVGRIVSVEAHPDADSLYVEQIDCGEAEGPRTIVSGLREYVSLESLQGRAVLVLANLKPRNMRGVKSNGMLLCASNAEHSVVEPLAPPEGAAVGERVFFGDDGAGQPEAAAPNQLQKKKYWEACQPLLKTGADRVAAFGDKAMLTSAGAVNAPTLADANIS